MQSSTSNSAAALNPTNALMWSEFSGSVGGTGGSAVELEVVSESWAALDAGAEGASSGSEVESDPSNALLAAGLLTWTVASRRCSPHRWMADRDPSQPTSSWEGGAIEPSEQAWRRLALLKLASFTRIGMASVAADMLVAGRWW